MGDQDQELLWMEFWIVAEGVKGAGYELSENMVRRDNTLLRPATSQVQEGMEASAVSAQGQGTRRGWLGAAVRYCISDCAIVLAESAACWTGFSSFCANCLTWGFFSEAASFCTTIKSSRCFASS
jgi:hypothetical protein